MKQAITNFEDFVLRDSIFLAHFRKLRLILEVIKIYQNQSLNIDKIVLF